MADNEEFIVGVLEGAIDKIATRIEREGGTVVAREGFSSTLRVTGKSRRELMAFPGVRFVEAGGPRAARRI